MKLTVVVFSTAMFLALVGCSIENGKAKMRENKSFNIVTEYGRSCEDIDKDIKRVDLLIGQCLIDNKTGYQSQCPTSKAMDLLALSNDLERKRDRQECSLHDNGPPPKTRPPVPRNSD